MNCFNQPFLNFSWVYESPDPYCWNGTNWYQVPTSLSGGTFLEEAIVWNIGYYPTNLTVKNNNYQIYQNLSEFNGTSTIDLNTTVLQGCVDTCSNPIGGNCLCELNFTSETAGILQLSNLNVTYDILPYNLDFTNKTTWSGSYYSDETLTRSFTVNSTFTSNLTNCNFNVSATSLRNIISQSENNFTIENQSLKAVNLSFINPSALDYSGHYLWVECDNTNKTSNIDIQFSVSNRPSPPTPGGGGTEVIVIEPKNETAILFFGLVTLSFTVITTPSESEKVLKFTNIGNKSFEGDMVIEGEANQYVNGTVCNINNEDCKTEGIKISSGESKLLVLNGIFTDELGYGAEGIIKFNSEQPVQMFPTYQRTLGIESSYLPTYELGLLIERPPLYKLYNWVADELQVPEVYALLLVYFTLISLVAVTFMSVLYKT